MIWKGKYQNEQQLLNGNLPDNAVMFKEPKTLAEMTWYSCLFIIPVIGIIGIILYIKISLGTIGKISIFSIYGVVLACLMIIPHEFLHAIAFPKHAEVQVWYSFKNTMMFVHSTYSISKLRFIYMCFLPSIIFGFLPLIVWIFIPVEFSIISEIIFSFAVVSLFLGIGDFLNIYNAIFQMPKNSFTQLSGLHSYWYLP